MGKEIAVHPERILNWRTERYPFTRQDIAPNEDGLWEASYGTVEDFDGELGGVPFTVFNQILRMHWEGYGEQAFVDLLNEPTTSPRHIVTFFEKEFRSNENHSPKAPFFSRWNDWPYIKAKRPCAFLPKDEFPFLIELVELERWARRNPDILPDSISLYENEADIVRLEYESALAAQKAENEALKARVAELENASKEDTAEEEIDFLRKALEKMESDKDALSSQLTGTLLMQAHLRKELEDLKAIHGKGLKLRTMWRYVLELEGRGMTDADIRNALKGDGFSHPAIDALLYPGTGENYSAVTKWFQRH